MSYITFERAKTWQAPRELSKARQARALEKTSAELTYQIPKGSDKVIREHLEIFLSNICLYTRESFFLPGHRDSFILGKEIITEQVRQLGEDKTLSIRAGLNPELLLENYLDTLKAVSKIRKHFSAFSINEIIFYSGLLKCPIPEILKLLKNSGVTQLGRSSKYSSESYLTDRLRIHELAHEKGISSDAELHLSEENQLSRIPEYLERVSNIQKKTRGFSSLQLTLGEELSLDTELKFIAFCKLHAEGFSKVRVVLPSSLKRISLLALEYGADEVVLVESYPKL